MKIIKKTLAAILAAESRLILSKYKPFIVAVTGSVGKTSTKDAIYNVLKSPSNCRADGTGMCYVRKSEKSLNSDIGLPLTIIGVSNAWYSVYGWLKNILSGMALVLKKREYPDCLVLEIGADHPGDITGVARWLKPDIAVITRISRTPVHVEFFASPEEVFEEKASLAEAVKPGGTVILFADDEKVMALRDRTKDKQVSVISFGRDSQAAVRGENVRIDYSDSNAIRSPIGFSFEIITDSSRATVSVKRIIGHTYIYPLLAAAAVGKARGMPFEEIIKGLNAYETPKGRMNIIPGISDSILIDDTYNSSPDAAIAALETLRSIESSGIKIAALGDMMELGSYSADEHRKIGREVASALGTNGRLVTVGQRSRATADEAVKSGLDVQNVRSFDTSVEAGEYLKSVAKAGDIILIKGSQSIRMEKAVKMVMRDPDQAEKLLVRQEREWLDKK